MTELIKALVKFQSEVGTIKKDQNNPFFKSKYADLAGFIDACRPAMVKSGLAITQTTKLSDPGAVLVTTLWHESGESIVSEYLLQPIKNDPQAMGSAITYARRYSFAGILGVAPEDDDDANLASGRNDQQPQYQQRNNNQPKQQTKPQQQHISYDHCPSCQAVALGKSIQGGGYYCFPKQGGCGKSFPTKTDDVFPAPQPKQEPNTAWLLTLEDKFKELIKEVPTERKPEFIEIHKEICDAIRKMEIPKIESLLKVWRVRLDSKAEVTQ